VIILSTSLLGADSCTLTALSSILGVFRPEKQLLIHSYAPGITLFFEYSIVHRVHSSPSYVLWPPHNLSHTTFPSPYSRPSKGVAFHCSGQNSSRSYHGAIPKRLLARSFQVWVKT
jgi:hypothetical protein